MKNHLDALKNNLSLTVIKYYFDYLSLEAKKDAKQKEIEQLTAQEDRIGRFYNAGTTTEDELQKIVSRLQNAIVELQEIELNIITITHNLEYITGTQVSITDGSKLEDINNLIQKSPRFDIQALDLWYSIKTKCCTSTKKWILPNNYFR